MRTLGFCLILMTLGGCATLERAQPLTSADVVALAQSGKSSKEIIHELWRTDTVLPLQTADIIKLHEAGVPADVLDYLQRAQIEEMRWRDRPYWGWYQGAFGPCPWGYPSGFMGPGLRQRRGFWGC
jgi:hypothetical protein